MGKHQGHCALDGFSILLSLIWAGVYCSLTVFQALGSIQESCLWGLHHNLPWPTPWDLAQGLKHIQVQSKQARPAGWSHVMG